MSNDQMSGLLIMTFSFKYLQRKKFAAVNSGDLDS